MTELGRHEPIELVIGARDAEPMTLRGAPIIRHGLAVLTFAARISAGNATTIGPHRISSGLMIPGTPVGIARAYLANIVFPDESCDCRARCAQTDHAHAREVERQPIAVAVLFTCAQFGPTAACAPRHWSRGSGTAIAANDKLTWRSTNIPRGSDDLARRFALGA